MITMARIAVLATRHNGRKEFRAICAEEDYQRSAMLALHHTPAQAVAAIIARFGHIKDPEPIIDIIGRDRIASVGTIELLEIIATAMSQYGMAPVSFNDNGEAMVTLVKAQHDLSPAVSHTFLDLRPEAEHWNDVL